MKTQSSHDTIAELVLVLRRLERLHLELDGVIREKIQRMRTSDIPGLRDATQREGELVRDAAGQETARRRLIDAIGADLGLSSAAARKLTIRQLVEQLGDHPHSSDLLDAGKRLRVVAARVVESNRIAGLIAEEVLRHVHHVFAAMTGLGETSGAYGGRGHAVASAGRRLFDAVG